MNAMRRMFASASRATHRGTLDAAGVDALQRRHRAPDKQMSPRRGPMPHDTRPDFYETLQLSPNADADTIQRVYRLLAQRFHPDNADTGDASRFREICDAYAVLSDPVQRAEYDVAHQQARQARWRLVDTGARAENDFEAEQVMRLTLLEVLYTRRRVEPDNPGMSLLDLEQLIGQPREHLEFTVWFLVQKTFVTRGDSANLTITAAGVEYLEQNYRTTATRRRLPAATT
jgi:curved DNA-binding protein CbpA